MKNCVISTADTDIIRVAEQIVAHQANIQGVEPEWLWHPNECQLPGHPDNYDDDYVDEIESHRPLKCSIRLTMLHSQIVVENVFHYELLGPLDGVSLKYYVARAISHMVNNTPAIIEIGVDFDTIAGVSLPLLRKQSRRKRTTTTTTRTIRRKGGANEVVVCS